MLIFNYKNVTICNHNKNNTDLTMRTLTYGSLWLIGRATAHNHALLENLQTQLQLKGKMLTFNKTSKTQRISLPSTSNSLILIDTLEMDYNSLIFYVGTILEQTHRCSIMLFNMSKGSELENIVRWPRVEAILFKHKQLNEITQTALKVAQGKIRIPACIIEDYFLNTRTTPIDYSAQFNFTARELHVLMHLAKGDSNKMIAHSMGISCHTVKTHIYKLFKKIQVTNRVQAVIWAKQNSYL